MSVGIWICLPIFRKDRSKIIAKNWHRRVYAAHSAHYAAADSFRLLNYVVGIPAVVFSCLGGTAIFAGLEHDSP